MVRIPAYFVIIIVLGMITIAACSAAQPTPETPDPADVYWEYWTYCDERREEKAELLLTQEARVIGDRFGVCSFMHDYSLGVGQFAGINELLLAYIDVEPDVSINGDTATLTWFSEDGMVIPVIKMNMVEGDWKINELLVLT